MRHKTKYTGVFFRKLSGSGGDFSFYIVYKKDGKIIEEKVGRKKKDKMTAFKAALLRTKRRKEVAESNAPGSDGLIKPEGNRLVDKKQLAAQVDQLTRKILEQIPLNQNADHSVEINRLMLEYANVAVYISQDGLTRFVNSKTEQITGFTSDQLVGRSSFDLTHPQDLETIKDRYEKRFRGETVSDLFPHRIVDKNGKIKLIEVSTVMVTWDGKPALLNFMRDITQRKADEDALKQSEQLRKDIFNFLPDATFAIDIHGRITAWNRAIEMLTGVSAKKMIGRGNYAYAKVFYGNQAPVLIDKVLNPSLKIREHYFSQESRDDFLLAETQIFYQGKPRIFWCKAGKMKDSQGNVIGAIESLRDISALKEMNTALDTLLKKREKDIKKSEEKIQRNIKELVLPHVMRLKSADLAFSQAVDIDMVESHLKEISSPFLNHLASGYARFSPREMEVASMIKTGMTSKEIARALHVSSNAIDIYRQNIRKKLGLNRKKMNLRSFLISMDHE